MRLNRTYFIFKSASELSIAFYGFSDGLTEQKVKILNSMSGCIYELCDKCEITGPDTLPIWI